MTGSYGTSSDWHRTGRSRPDEELLDRMIYRMAGLSDADIAGLEDRLAGMS
jgi:hypothetical protein